MKNLVIVESPSKSKTIGKYLGTDYLVVSSKGHIRDLAIKGKDGLGVDIENDFAPIYEISKDKVTTVKELQKLAERADYVYLATDPDREGEAISWHLAQELGLDEDAIDRVTFHEITKNAVQQAFSQPRAIDMDLVHSQETRRILDRIIGFRLSKLLKSKISSKSAGRVQSVALKLIVEREKEINAFVPQEYWSIDGVFNKDGESFNASLAKVDGEKVNIENKEQAQAILERCQGDFIVSAIRSSRRNRSPRPPFITSTLQQEASTKLSFSAKRTMSIAQKLYEGIDVGNGEEGLITYMRTDSTRLSDVFVSAARTQITERYGKEYLGTYTVRNDEGAQDAHEAIRPTNLAYTPERVKEYLSSEQYRLYRMIYDRAVASLMAPAAYNQLSISLERNGCVFYATGSTLDFDGYLKVYGDYDSSKDVILPLLSEGEVLKDAVITPNQHFTEPPSRYTEAKLIKALEEDGIGRPSTYAMIIDTIQIRGYVTLDRVSEKSRTKVFRPTDQGILTTEKLDEYFSSIINVDYTAQMEQTLDEIAEGKQEEVTTLRDFYDRFTPLLDKAYQDMEKIAPEKTGETCPECGGDLVYRNGRFGRFISCSNFPKCKYTAQMEKEGKEKPEPTGKMCPECGSELLKRKSRFGSFFLGCSGFPKCTYMENLDGERIYSRKEKLKMKEEAQATGLEDSEEKPKKKSTKKASTTKKKTTTTKKKTSTSTKKKTTVRKKKTDEVAE